jgi:hypothetical protein
MNQILIPDGFKQKAELAWLRIRISIMIASNEPLIS